jgi:hypothetical protein
MISIRLSDREYIELKEACSAQGVRSMSEAARLGICTLLISGGAACRADSLLQRLQTRVDDLAAKIEEILDRLPMREREP